MEKTIGKHYAPNAVIIESNFETVSVGVSEVFSCSSKKGSKLGPAKVRIIGYNTDSGVVVIARLAELVARLLDEGKYVGPKNLSTDSKLAKKLLEEQ